MTSTPNSPAEPVDLGDHYRRSRVRLQTLLGDSTDDELTTTVLACPGWNVHDVIAHLVGIIEDAFAGKISGVPSPAQTQDQVTRHAATSVSGLIEIWESLSDPFQDAVSERQIWPAMLDVLSHEQDIRSALDRPGARDVDSIRIGADRLLDMLDSDAIEIRLDDSTTFAMPVTSDMTGAFPADDGKCRLTTSHFEFFRLRLGRRSTQQVIAMDWSRDPGLILDELFIFGPSLVSLAEPDAQ